MAEERSQRARVVALTPAPALDRVYSVEGLTAGSVNRATEVRADLAGKGVNVSHTLALAGNQTLSVLPWAGEMRQLPPQSRVVSISEPVRVNIVLIDATGQTTNINQAAHPIDVTQWRLLVEKTLESAAEIKADWLVIAGTLPNIRATRSDIHGLHSVATVDLAGLIRSARHVGLQVCVDSEGAHLRALLESGLSLDLVKPNGAELAEATGTTIHTFGDAVRAAQLLRDAGAGTVLASLGADGILLVADGCELVASAAADHVVNTTGAGDAALAGFLGSLPHGRAPSLADLRHAISGAAAWGALAVAHPTAKLQNLSHLPDVSVGLPISGQVLTEQYFSRRPASQF